MLHDSLYFLVCSRKEACPQQLPCTHCPVHSCYLNILSRSKLPPGQQPITLSPSLLKRSEISPRRGQLGSMGDKSSRRAGSAQPRWASPPNQKYARRPYTARAYVEYTLSRQGAKDDGDPPFKLSDCHPGMVHWTTCIKIQEVLDPDRTGLSVGMLSFLNAYGMFLSKKRDFALASRCVKKRKEQLVPRS
eukprot:1149364-Pelagomonas_calceolata.AAC.8